jgi:hypothetical protein
MQEGKEESGERKPEVIKEKTRGREIIHNTREINLKELTTLKRIGTLRSRNETELFT